MGWIVAFAILWLVLRRRRRRMWRRWARQGFVDAPRGPWLARRGARGWGQGAWRASLQAQRGEPLPLFDPALRSPVPAAPPESDFEKLKRRYVAGELSDEQYEAELDVLFRTPEGRRQV